MKASLEAQRAEAEHPAVIENLIQWALEYLEDGYTFEGAVQEAQNNGYEYGTPDYNYFTALFQEEVEKTDLYKKRGGILLDANGHIVG